MRVICVGFCKLTANIITNLARICPWSKTPHFLEKLSHLQRVKSSPSHKSAACIIDIDEPPNSGAAGYRDNSTRNNRRWAASKGLVRLITNRASVEQNTSSDFDVEIGFGTNNIGCLHA